MVNTLKVSDFEMMLLKSSATLEQSGRSTLGLVDLSPLRIMEKSEEMVAVLNLSTKQPEFIPGFRSVATNNLYYMRLLDYPKSFEFISEANNDIEVPIRFGLQLSNVDFTDLRRYLGCSEDNNFLSHLLMGSTLYSWFHDSTASIRRFTRSGIPLGEYRFEIVPIVQQVIGFEIDMNKVGNRFVHPNFLYSVKEPKHLSFHVCDGFEVTVVLSKSRQSKEGSNVESRKKGTPLKTEMDEQAELEL